MNSNFVLKTTIFSGFMLALILGAALAGIYITGRVVTGEQESRFSRLLGQYDYQYRRALEEGTLRQDLDRFENELTRLEKQVQGVESWLSILKRRRQMAGFDFRFKQAYVQSSRRAALAFPHSAPIAAVAAAAIVHDSAITREDAAELRAMLPLFFEPRFAPIDLSLHVLLGDFRDPLTASACLPAGYSYDAAGTEGTQAIAADAIILKIFAGDIPGASGGIEYALAGSPSPALIRLAAEFFYDFGTMLRSAELFSLLDDEAALSRQADALWLAGYPDSARSIWAVLQGDGIPENRALYNLALTAEDGEEAAALYQRLVAAETYDACRDFGLIHYSRLLDAQRAVTLLGAERDPISPRDPLIDLEIVRRRSEIAETGRTIAESWMLLERFPLEEGLYRWAAWYFDLHRSFGESALLLRTAARHGFNGQWKQVHDALAFIREGNLDAAENALAASGGENAPWEALANLGRVLESRHAPAQARANYEKAFQALLESAPDSGWRETASLIQHRIARCYMTQGRTEESRLALEYALDLNPDNLRARMELGRL
ncbi:MAG: hypothetical protein FWG46_00310 [Treponema sp.]|nr:hypothetical protein [Treponema sp.]